MRQSQYEIVVLKPTAAFLSFLTLKLSGIKLPILRVLQIDNTAFAFEKNNSNKTILEQIEENYPIIFQHEVSRWLGDKADNKIDIKFLDFLCCFTFELHSHIILMESSIEKSHQLLLIKPRLTLQKWINTSVKIQEDLQDVVEKTKLIKLTENTIVLVRNFSNLTEIKPFIRRHFCSIYATVMSQLSIEAEQGPVIGSVQVFNQYFITEIHTKLIYLPSF